MNAAHKRALKKSLYLLAIPLAVSCGRSQTYNATITVLDESGQPVASADVEMSSYIVSPPGQPETGGKVHGATDTNGICRLSHANTGSVGLGFQVSKSGYYVTTKGHEFAKFKDSDPAKWQPAITLVIRRIGHPIPMFAKHVETKIPREDEKIGFDLTIGDWVSPYGSGKTADLFFKVHRSVLSERDYSADVNLSFPREGDGVAVATAEPDTGSSFRTSRTAQESGYNPDRSWHFSPKEKSEPIFGYFIRVRTDLASDGNIRSALYGKIRGDLRFYVGTKAPQAGIGFDYYLNPSPNDLNVEFDPAHNLLTRLPSSSEIADP